MTLSIPSFPNERTLAEKSSLLTRISVALLPSRPLSWPALLRPWPRSGLIAARRQHAAHDEATHKVLSTGLRAATSTLGRMSLKLSLSNFLTTRKWCTLVSYEEHYFKR